ncbi:hypothetical protein FNF27_01533 [Cafeteria roenbergensis]|uniref:Serine aminopeptidase S33 domain-containing protein n=1 Tax=Cafeteria roenbergensis TaxID=33653 RepID=A0A5A8C2P3_CAFRO|nr:hypothetical protein FNF29_07420 [Cafeteria roenbergensis]KAA0177204.1 hypothetical protein FNF27_01533 [Cafeteria roenbergensis]|eukprot:KAA0147352.1 hypothetical protein FNF29_07420 [Cafeteria roenbergensis]
MDFLFSGSGIAAAAVAATLGASTALALAFGDEDPPAGPAEHRAAGTQAAAIAAGRVFPSKSTGMHLAFREWNPRAEVRMSVVVLHGFGEHCGRYDHVARALGERCGAAVFAYDHQGHGASEGVRAHCKRFSDLVDDAEGFLAFLRASGRLRDGEPLVILGHSMGGLVAAHLCRRIQDGRVEGVTPHAAGPVPAGASVPFVGLVLSSPFFKVAAATDTPALRAASSALSATLPLLPVVALDVNAVAANASVRSQYAADPLVYHGMVRARMGAEMSAACASILASAKELVLPSLHLVFGGSDTLVDPQGARDVAAACSVAEGGISEVLELEGSLHEVLNDDRSAEVIDGIAAFLLRRRAAVSR